MNGRAFINWLRMMAETMRQSNKPSPAAEFSLLADAVEEADASFRTTIESECSAILVPTDSPGIVDVWWETRCKDLFEPDRYHSGPTIDVMKALSYLDRRGLIERKSGGAHLIRFVEEV